ncbi:MAG: transcriptional regulator with XRE-family HTH domain [Paracoccaceae bacterium]|jgi:transcriptional regulator with XRE-family HTH domain
MTQEQTDWYGQDSATFGDRVAGAREATGMTQAQLARRLGVKKVTLVGWEDDLSEPRANRLSMMAGLLNVSIMWLLTGEGDGTSGPVEETVATPAFGEVLAELREIRAAMRANTERTARLEKKLRLLLQQEQP